MSDAETRSDHEFDAADSPPDPAAESAPPPAPPDQTPNQTTDQTTDRTRSNGKLTLPPVQTTLTDPRLFEIINWAITVMSSEADFLRTPPWERDIAWLEHTRFERAVVREMRLNGENMTVGGEKARIVTASGALSTNFPSAHRRNFGTLIIVVGAIILVPAAAFEPVLSIVALSIMAVGALLIVRQGQLRTTLDVQSTGFSVNGDEARPLEDLVSVRVQSGSDRVVVKCRNPREELIVAPRLVVDQRDFVRKTLEMEVDKIRSLNSFLKRRKSYETIDEDRPKLDLDAIQREVAGDDEPLEDFVDFDGDVLEETDIDGLPEIPDDGLEESTAVEGENDDLSESSDDGLESSNEQPETSNEQPGSSNEQPETSNESTDQQPETSNESTDEQPETSNEQPGTSNEQPEAGNESTDEQPETSNGSTDQQPETSNESTDEQPETSNESTDEQPETSNEKPETSNEKPETENQNPVSNNE